MGCIGSVLPVAVTSMRGTTRRFGSGARTPQAAVRLKAGVSSTWLSLGLHGPKSTQSDVSPAYKALIGTVAASWGLAK